LKKGKMPAVRSKEPGWTPDFLFLMEKKTFGDAIEKGRRGRSYGVRGEEREKSKEVGGVRYQSSLRM